MSSEPPEVLQREEGRRLFGRDVGVYEAGRPQYPEAVYDALGARCGPMRGALALEIGPGTGLVTRRLLETGASVVAVEPDPRLASYLRATFEDHPLEVIESTLESAALHEEVFDLALAATSFHWIDQEPGLTTLSRVLKPGGSVALWWTLYGDPKATDQFTRAVDVILGPSTRGAFDELGRPPFQLDVEHRLRDLRRWGSFVDVTAEIFETASVLDSERARALYASMATVLRREPDEQATVLDAIERLVEDDFGGAVERRFVTALYTGRRPG